MKQLRRLLVRRETVVAALALLIIIAAALGGPWFAFFTGGLVALGLGFVWWTSREKKTQRAGRVVMSVGATLTVVGLAIGNNPNLLPNRALPYTPVIPRPTVPVVAFPEIAARAPATSVVVTTPGTPSPAQSRTTAGVSPSNKRTTAPSAPRSSSSTRTTTTSDPVAPVVPSVIPVAPPTTTAPIDPPTTAPPTTEPVDPPTEPVDPPTTEPVDPPTTEPVDPTAGPTPLP